MAGVASGTPGKRGHAVTRPYHPPTLYPAQVWRCENIGNCSAYLYTEVGAPSPVCPTEGSTWRDYGDHVMVPGGIYLLSRPSDPDIGPEANGPVARAGRVDPSGAWAPCGHHRSAGCGEVCILVAMVAQVERALTHIESGHGPDNTSCPSCLRENGSANTGSGAGAGTVGSLPGYVARTAASDVGLSDRRPTGGRNRRSIR